MRGERRGFAGELWAHKDGVDLVAGLETVVELAAAFYDEELLATAQGRLLLKGQKMLDARVLCAGDGLVDNHNWLQSYDFFF